MRVLIVDDNEDLRRLVRSVVAGLGCDVVGESEDGQAGVIAALATEPDLVIMDWSMPVMDGVAATAAIRARRPEIDVIAYSSAADPEVAEQFKRAGASSYIHKADADGLVEAVKRRLAAPAE